METTQKPAQPKFVRFAVLLGIVIVLNVFFSVLVSTVLKEPQYDAFCPADLSGKAYDTKQACMEVGGMWTDTSYAGPSVDKTLPSGYCDAQYQCRMAYEAASKDYARNAFVALIALGVVSLLAGILPIGSSIVSSGLSYGGVVTLFMGSVEYWGSADNLIRLLISLIALLILLFVGWKRFKD